MKEYTTNVVSLDARRLEYERRKRDKPIPAIRPMGQLVRFPWIKRWHQRVDAERNNPYWVR